MKLKRTERDRKGQKRTEKGRASILSFLSFLLYRKGKGRTSEGQPGGLK